MAGSLGWAVGSVAEKGSGAGQQFVKLFGAPAGGHLLGPAGHFLGLETLVRSGHDSFQGPAGFGFIGAFLVKKLLEEADDVIVGLDNLNSYYDPGIKDARLRMLAEADVDGRFTFVRGDLCDAALIERLFAENGFDVVVNLAAQAGVRYSIENPRAYLESNLVGFFAVDIEGFLRQLGTIIPAEVLDLLIQYLRYVSRVSSRTLMTFSLIFSIWFPMRAANALLLSVRKAYGMGRPTQFLRHQAKVFLYTICLILTILLSLVLVTVGRSVLNLCADYFHFSAILTDGFIELWSTLRFVFLGCIVFLALAVLYGLAQETRSVHYVWPGVLFSLTAWMVLSLLFSLYVENAANYSVIYGSIGAIIVLLLWLYLSATMMIMGAEFNSVLMEMKTARG